jgi:DNA-binding beta-propeller fold protein YncE
MFLLNTAQSTAVKVAALFFVFLSISACKGIVHNDGDTGGKVTGAVIASASAAFDCGSGGSVCARRYISAGTEILTATPEANYVFSGWAGACEGQGAVCTLPVTTKSWIETEALFDFSQVTVDPITDQQVSQNFSTFNMQATGSSSVGAIIWSVTNTRPDAVNALIDDTTGELTISPITDEFGNAEIEVIATVSSGDFSSTRFGLVVTMPDNPVFACGTGVETETGDTLPGSYTLFEFGQSRPLAMSPDGRMLFLLNTPANCLEIYNVETDTPLLISSVVVGMEPTAVAARTDTEVWVVNGVSDSVSIVDIRGRPHVERTLLVGDEPRDIVFDGSGRAYITAAYRGQNHPTFDIEDLFTEGLGRADVWVFDGANPGGGMGGAPLTILNLFTDAPRALAVSQDGNTVYAAGFFTGNQTTVIDEHSVEAGGGSPAPTENTEGITAPRTGLIVKFDGTNWVDEVGTIWDSEVNFSLPDLDVFEIDASLAMPALVASHSGVGTTLFNMATSPDGKVLVSNTEARNHVRFEGEGDIATTVRGHIAENRVTIIDGATVTPVQLNQHIDFDLPFGQQVSNTQKRQSIAQPGPMAYINGELWVLPFGSKKIQVYSDPAVTGSGNWFDTPWLSWIGLALPDAGPSGIAVQDYRGRAYVYTAFGHKLSVISTELKYVINTVDLFSPEPVSVKDGRPFLYDAQLTSGNGTGSCGSCHIFGDFDGLAWDLGHPEANVATNTNIFVGGGVLPGATFHPMKGPMTTQTFRGINDSGPMHWRGDRTGRDAAGNLVPGETIESQAFKQFNPAFVGLVGRPTELDPSDLQAFTDFALQIVPPANPVRNLDDSLTTDQAAGESIYFNDVTDGNTCNVCHLLDPAQNAFGTAGLSTTEGGVVSQEFKVPHLRNMYQKVGMFGTSWNTAAVTYGGGPQIKGFGYLHDGSIDTLDNFFGQVFAFVDPVNDPHRMSKFNAVVDSNLKPIVGQQVTLTQSNSAAAGPRIDLLIARSLAGDCDLLLWSSTIDVPGGVASARLLANGQFKTSLDGNPEVTDVFVRNRVATTGEPVTYTCVPPGNGIRLSQVP